MPAYNRRPRWPPLRLVLSVGTGVTSSVAREGRWGKHGNGSGGVRRRRGHYFKDYVRLTRQETSGVCLQNRLSIEIALTNATDLEA